jgi:orotidine-5'-phosphate decarboxylase
MDQLLIALDVDDAAAALRLADALRGAVGGFKVGSQLFTREGPAIARALAERGDRVFLDLKFHDIPTTVAGAVRAAARLGAWMLTVHACGGADMLRAAAAAARDEAATSSGAAPRIVGVTVLTSMGADSLGRIGVARSLDAQVDALADLARESGLDGIVASPLEAARIRARCGADFLIVTPGIRPAGAAGDDQARTAGAAEAIRAGADYLVVGRPVVRAPDPRAAVAAIAAELP